MICKECKKEIDDDSIFCIYCKTPTDLIPNIQLIEDGEKPVVEDPHKKSEKKEPIHETERKEKTVVKKKSKKKWIFTSISIAVIIVMAIIVLSQNSYGSLIKKAQKLDRQAQYENAFSIYEKALDKNPNGVEAMVGCGIDMYYLEKYDEAIDYLKDALSEDAENEDAFIYLLMCYDAIGDTEKIDEADTLAKTEEMKKALQTFLNSRPVFSEPGGSYSQDMMITITAGGGGDIYYTLNGSDPKENGIEYKEPIELLEGTTVIRAVCKNKDGYGVELRQEYEIVYEIPPYPNVSPSGGTFTAPTSITITSQVTDAAIYYTWDGSTPTKSSTRYRGPIPVEEGNNILSIVVYDVHDNCSEVLQCNYTYYPSGE